MEKFKKFNDKYIAIELMAVNFRYDDNDRVMYFKIEEDESVFEWQIELEELNEITAMAFIDLCMHRMGQVKEHNDKKEMVK